MTLTLSTSDLQHLSRTTEALLTAPGGGGVDAWWRDVESRLLALFPRAHAMLALPASGALTHHSHSLDAAALRRFATLSTADPGTGQLIVADPVAETWLRVLRREWLTVWGEARAFHLLGAQGVDGRRSVFYNEALVAAPLRDYTVLSTDARGELFLTIGYERRGVSRFGDDELVLGLLGPALRAAHQALALHAPRAAALAADAEGAGEALMVVGADGRECHRSLALARALHADPEREPLAAAMREAAEGLRLLRTRAARQALPAPAERLVVTRVARYAVRATYGDPGAWGTPDPVVVTLTLRDAALVGPGGVRTLAARPPARPAMAALPTSRLTAAVPAALRQAADAQAPRLVVGGGDRAAADPLAGLTGREVEVARLLARRLTNAEMAAALGVSAHTVRHHTERVMQKLGVRSRRDVATILLAEREPVLVA